MPWSKESNSQSLDSDSDDVIEFGDPRDEDHSGSENNHKRGHESKDSSQAGMPKGYTPPKGRATPKRNEVERAQGIRKSAYSAPETAKEARARRKELKNSMSKEEYKAHKQREREENARKREQNRERMMSGDERYMLARDRGPERKLIRDWVDSRRLIANTLMPVVIVLLLFMFLTTATKNLMLNNLLSIAGMVVLLLMVIEGVISARRVSKVVKERYPNTELSTFSMGFYAFSRASMIRKMRTPRPQVEIGDAI